MSLFESLPVDRAVVSTALRAHWGLELGALLRASQNHTFAAARPATGAQFAVRVVPDPHARHHARVAAEAAFVSWLAGPGALAGACAPMPPSLPPAAAAAASPALRVGPYTLVVMPWAPGAMLDYAALRWATDAAVVEQCGAWLARLHAASRAFSAAHPAASAAMRRWDELHGGVMTGAPLHPDDAAAQAAACAAPSGTSHSFLILHADLNVGNFHVEEEEAAAAAGGCGGGGGGLRLHVFDWDQCARGWAELDLAHAAGMVAMLQEGGMPPGGAPVPAADVGAYLRGLVRGYEAVAGAGAIDAARLDRLLQLRKLFFARFTQRALEDAATPEPVRAAMAYNAAWLARAPPRVEGWVCSS